MADQIEDKCIGHREKDAEGEKLLPLESTGAPGANTSNAPSANPSKELPNNAVSSAPEIKKTEVTSEESDDEKREKEPEVGNAGTRKRSGHGADEAVTAGYKKKSFPERYENSMKMLLPVRCAPQKGKEIPIHNAGFLSNFSFHWITSFMWKTYRSGSLDHDQMWTCPPEESTDVNGKRFVRLWTEEVKRRGMKDASLGWVMFRFLRTTLVVATIIHFVSVTFAFIGPAFLFRLLLEYVRSSESNLSYGLILTLVLFVTEFGRMITMVTQLFFAYILGLRIRSAFMYMIFSKALRLRSMKDKSAGQVVNFFANDCQRFLELATFSTLVLSGPLTAIAGTICCVYYLGPWALLGAGVIMLYYPYQATISKLTTYVRKKAIVVTDKRVRMINEILTSIKLIKLYAWEKSFAKAVTVVRKAERRLLQYAAYLQTMSIAINPMVPVFASVCTFIGHILAGNDLTASQAFVVVAIYNVTKMKVAILPRLVRVWSEVIVGLARAKDYMAMEEIDVERFLVRPSDPRVAVELNDATFAWDVNASDEKRERKKKENKKPIYQSKTAAGKNLQNGVRETEIVPIKSPSEKQLNDSAAEASCVDVLFDINLSVPKGSLCGICGRVGSGKSSLLSAMLGQMIQRSGGFASDGRFCYVPQQAWILNSTVRENILFGLPYDKLRYETVLRQCNLTYDLKILPSGDMTEIGERGINLSGGQKQRVSLARAVYSDRDIYLLDDPLSAVDPQVGSHLFENCLMKCAANNKTVIFVTHQLQYLNRCDSILLMKDGRIFEQGTHESLMLANGEYASLIKTYYSDQEKERRMKETSDELDRKTAKPGFHASISIDSVSSQTSLHLLADGKLVEDEKKERGAVTLKTYDSYIKSAGGYCLMILTILSFVIPVICAAFSNWWLSYWISQGSGNTSTTVYNESLSDEYYFNVTTTTSGGHINDNPNMKMYVLVYGLSSVAVVLTLGIRGFLFAKVTLRASSNIHDKAFSRLLRSPMSYFDVTPIGRMLNRFSKDLDEIDVRLPFNAEELIQNVCLVLCAITMLCLVFPWYLIAAVPLVAIFWFVQSVARTVIREVKRVDNVTRSPIFSLIATSVQGLQTIHAYNKEEEFLNRFKYFLDENTPAVMIFFIASRWLTVRLELITIFTMTFISLLVVLTKGQIPPSYAGLALVYANQLTGLFQYTIRLISETEARFTSVERMEYYLKETVEEAAWVIAGSRPPPSWPHKGRVTYVDYSMRYRPRLPLVLEKVSCQINAAENIGIVGRTGSGKTSFASALFRLTEPEAGTIIIDDVDISTIGLTDLRSKLSIIPQDPLLFIGTIRYNIDPFEEHSDSELWNALEKCYMKSMVANLPERLESSVVENGENFSVGERQLLCMARALLRSSKVLVLDEATAAVDTEMDARIQKTIMEAFSGCTIFTIAHRLNTVLHCNRVMVLDKGRIIEFDRPDVLLQDPNSRFFHMVRRHH